MGARNQDVKIRILSEYYDVGSRAAERAMRRNASLQMAAANEDIAREAQRAAAVVAANRRQAESMSSMGRTVLGVSAAVATGLGLAVKAAMDWQSAWAGVTKTVSGDAGQMAQLESELRGLAGVLPATHAEIAGVAEAAGQLGVARADIADFTRTMINMGETTNLSSDEAATGMAQLSNIMGTTAAQASRLGSAIVALGNDGASTERDILSMGLRIAGAGRTVGMTADQVLAIASALSSVGLEAEAGGTAVSRVMLQIDKDVAAGSETVARYAQVSGVSAAEFATRWKTDAAGALTEFIAGLGRVQAEGGNTTGVLESLGFTEVRVTDALRRAALAGDLLTDALDTGSQAWEENSALAAEAAKRYETTESKLAIARNQINNAAIDIGGNLLPAIASAGDAVGSLAVGFGTLPAPVQEWVVKLGAAAAGLGLVTGAAAVAIPKLAELKATVEMLHGGSSRLGRALGGTASVLTGPWGLAVAGAVTVLGFWMKAQGDAKRDTDEMVDTLDDQTAAITENTRALAFNRLEEAGVIDAAKRYGIALDDLVDASVDPTSEAFLTLQAQQAAFSDELLRNGTIMRENGEGGWEMSQAYADFLIVMDSLGGVQDDVAVSQARMRDEIAAGIHVSGDAAGSQEGLADQLATTTGVIGDQNEVLADGTVVVEDAVAAIDLLSQSLDELNSPTLDAREAERRFAEAVDAVAAAVEENGTTLDINTEAGRANQEVLDSLAEAGARRAQTLLEQTGSEEEFRASLEASRRSLHDAAIQLGLSEEAAWAYVDSVLAVPPEVTTTAELDTAAAQSELDGFIARNHGKRIRLTAEVSTSGNPVYVTAAGTRLEGTGDILEFMSRGGLRPMAPVAQIVPPSTWRVVGDRSDVDELYAPLDGSSRSRALWWEAGSRMGWDAGAAAGSGSSGAGVLEDVVARFASYAGRFAGAGPSSAAPKAERPINITVMADAAMAAQFGYDVARKTTTRLRDALAAEGLTLGAVMG